VRIFSRLSANADSSAMPECFPGTLVLPAPSAAASVPSRFRARTSFNPLPSPRRMFNSLTVGLVAAMCLAGCGAEVAGTAATAAKLEAASAEKAKAQAEKLKQELEVAGTAREEAASAAEQ